MDEASLYDLFAAELVALEKSGAALPLATLRPSEAWYLLAGLQLALRQPGLDGKPREFLDGFARNIEGRLSKNRPAIAEAARKGWDQAERAEEEKPPARPPAPSPEPVAEKLTESPENKMLKSPETKTGKGRKRS